MPDERETIDLPERRGNSQPDPMPKWIGRYKILGVLGEGGFGVVYEAEQSEPRRRVALKVIKAGMDSKAVIARFEAERQALAVLDHPGVSKLFDGGLTPADQGNRPYFAMELVRGDPITVFCDRNRLDVTARVRLFLQVCAAVQHAHTKGVIHRDLKPSNILVTHSESGPQAKVIDLGLAKALTSKLTDSTVYTAMGQLIGTPDYMSPEQAEMSGTDIDTRSDVYSLGVVLYELLTGQHPIDSDRFRQAGFGGLPKLLREFQPPTPSARLSALKSGDPESMERMVAARDANPAALRRQLKGELDWIVMKCLEKERERRYESANELALELKRFLDSNVVLARPPSRIYAMKKFIQRNKVGVGVTALIALAMVSATAISLESLKRTRIEARRSNEVKGLVIDMLAGIDPELRSVADLTVKSFVDDAAHRLEAGQITDSAVAGEMHSVIGTVYCNLQELSEAERHLNLSIELLESASLGMSEQTLNAMDRLGEVYFLDRRRSRCVEIYEDLYDRANRALGPEHSLTLEAGLGLSKAYRNLGVHDRALEEGEAVLRISERVFGRDDPKTLEALLECAVACDQMGKNARAEQFYRDALRGTKRVHGSNHPQTIVALTSLGVFYTHQNHYAEAEPILLESLKISERLMGARHDTTLWTKGNLGALYLSMGQYSEAVDTLESVVDIGRESLSPGQGVLTRAAKHLATALDRLEREDEASEYHRLWVNSVIIRAESSSAGSEDLNSAASILLSHPRKEFRDAAKALSFAQRACSVEKEQGGARLWIYLDTLASAEQLLGDVEAAIHSKRRAVSVAPADADQLILNRMTEELHKLDDELSQAGQGS